MYNANTWRENEHPVVGRDSLWYAINAFHNYSTAATAIFLHVIPVHLVTYSLILHPDNFFHSFK